jgi:hypothetical protein
VAFKSKKFPFFSGLSYKQNSRANGSGILKKGCVPCQQVPDDFCKKTGKQNKTHINDPELNYDPPSIPVFFSDISVQLSHLRKTRCEQGFPSIKKGFKLDAYFSSISKERSWRNFKKASPLSH